MRKRRSTSSRWEGKYGLREGKYGLREGKYGLRVQGKYGLKWTDDFDVLGISYNIKNMGEITEINISNKIKDIKKLVSVWKTRRLTPYGKVVLIKSLLFSKFTHILLSLPSPEKNF